MSAPAFLHVDMDAFFVSVELLDRPELRGRPVVVGGAGPRGVVAAASYEARAFGVHSAMPSARARQLCPDAVFLGDRHSRYVEVSQRIMERFRQVTPLVEPISLDEAFLDVTGAQRLHGDPMTIARDLRRQIAEEEQLGCSVGIAPVKFVAKLASEEAKPIARPDGPVEGPGVFEVTEQGLLGFLHPLAIRRLWGVGPATAQRLERLGVATVGDLAALPLESVEATLGRGAGRHLHALANGIDDRGVDPHVRARSIGHEETYATDLVAADQIDRELVRLADAVAGRLRRADLEARTVTVKVRFGDFTTITRSTTPAEAVTTGRSVLAAARRLVGSVDTASGVRLLGVSVSGLGAPTPRQLRLDDLFDDPAPGPSGDALVGGEARVEVADRVVDDIRERFGEASIGPARLVEGDQLRVRRRGAAPWGPSRVDGGDEGLDGE